MASTTIDATFSNIYNLDKDAKHSMAEISFEDARFYEDDPGYFDMYIEGEDAYLLGGFFGDGHAEIAGTFNRHNVSGAFGARKMTN